MEKQNLRGCLNIYQIYKKVLFLIIDTEMVFKFEFADVTRVKALVITWIVLPDEIKIEFSSDNGTWDVAKNWYRYRVNFL